MNVKIGDFGLATSIGELNAQLEQKLVEHKPNLHPRDSSTFHYHSDVSLLISKSVLKVTRTLSPYPIVHVARATENPSSLTGLTLTVLSSGPIVPKLNLFLFVGISSTESESENVGTYLYTSPEGHRGEKCDIYSLGIVLFEVSFSQLAIAKRAFRNLYLFVDVFQV